MKKSIPGCYLVSFNEFFIKVFCAKLYVLEVAPTKILIIRVSMNRTKLKIAKLANCHMHVYLHLVEVVVVIKVVFVVELNLLPFCLHLSSQALACHPVCLCTRPYLKHDFLLHFLSQASER